jgi:uncharacterized membrane protein
MNFLKNILNKKIQVGILFVSLGLIIALFTKIKFLSFLFIFILAVLLAFYIEYNTNQSKLMKFIRKWF